VPAAQRPLDRRYRYRYKPLVFIACLVPLLGCIGGIAASSGFAFVPGFSLGTDPVRFVLDTLAKSALNLLFITLAITPLRQLSGNVHLLRLRRMLGLFAFSYALLHFLTYLGPYQGFSWHDITKDILKRPFITIGFTALCLLVPLALTSTDSMQRRLGRRWQALHRLIWLVAALAVLHFWKMLKHEYLQPLMYACVLAALLAWRLWRRYRPNRARSKSEPPKAQGKA
jgi:methionine sulfoxide reductase heme-binding subunit